MSKDLKTHSAHLELNEPAPAELPVGSDFVLQVKLSCPAGCDLGTMPLAVTGPDGQVATFAPAFDQEAAPSEVVAREIALQAPQQVGEHVWVIRFLPQERAGLRHEECTLPVHLRTVPHATSLAVWAVPSPVVMGERFSVKVGAKSAAACDLKGRKIAISNQAGAVIARANLGDTPWPGTSALYWTEVEVKAPDQEGMFWYAVNFAATDVETPHDGASSKFSVAIVRPPEHRLTVEVLEKDTKVPIEDAQVRLGAYRAATDPAGRAEVAMPKGTYDLTIWKVGYDAPSQIVDVSEDISIQIEAEIVPPENPDAAWIM
jgi:hypothetical protein